ncbi:transporter substrate-binding domain-containing protein [Porticoccaceae bacterium]|nr:transporter substrate-binding domain-containing protein [Porticoccaceae bacterium]
MSAPLHLIFVCVTALVALGFTLTTANADTQVEQVATADKLTLQSSLTEPERNWLRKNRTIRHGIISNQMPFEYIDDNGQYRGLTSDYIAIISEQLDISFEPFFFTDLTTLSKGIRENQVDLASYLPPPRGKLSYSESVIEMPIALFGRQDSALIVGIESIRDERVVIEKPSKAEQILSKFYPQIAVSYVDTPAEGIQAVLAGKADIFIHNVFSVEYYTRKLGLPPLKSVSNTPYTFDIAFAVTEELRPFIPIFQKVISGLSKRERQLIFDKWVNIEITRKLDLKRIGLWAGAALLLILLVFLAILRWNKILQERVAYRTQELELSSKNLRSLARHMDQVREEEKAKLAREIHDELGHTLISLTMAVRRLKSTASKNFDQPGVTGSSVQSSLVQSSSVQSPQINSSSSQSSQINSSQVKSAELNNQFDEIKALLLQASSTSRSIMSDLRPSVLEDLGLAAAIEWLAHEFEIHHQTLCIVRGAQPPDTISPAIAIAVFRIVQESLTNIAKHAKAKKVQIKLSSDNGLLKIEIIDDGIGLQAGWDNKEGSFGFQGMRERAMSFNGEISVANGKKSGVILRLQIPYQK